MYRNMNLKKSVIIFWLFVISFSLFGQTVDNPAAGDTLFKQMSVEDLIRIREYYSKQAEQLLLESEKTRTQGMEISESFLGEKGSSIKDRDKVYIRIAEYYIEEAETEQQVKAAKFDEQLEEYSKQLQLFDDGKITGIPTEPKFPKFDYGKAISLYDRLLKEYPGSDFADDALYSKAWLLSKMEQNVESRKIFQEVIDKYPESNFAAESYMQLAEYFFSPREDKNDEQQIFIELQKAIQLYKKVLTYRESRRYDEALYKLGWSYYKLSGSNPKYYPEAITYFVAVADDIARAKKLDPKEKISKPSVFDEAITYIGISFTDESYTKNGTDKARNFIQKIGGRDYGVKILRSIGETYQKIDELPKAIYAFETLLDMYPAYEDAPRIVQNIINAEYAGHHDAKVYETRLRLYINYGPNSEWYNNLEQSQIPDRITYLNRAYTLSEAATRANLSVDLIAAQELESSAKSANQLYSKFAESCKNYLQFFPSDSNAYDINWSYAYTLDSKLGRFEDAYEEYIRVSNDYIEKTHQHDAALNAVNVADTLLAVKTKIDTSTVDLTDITQLNPELLSFEETRLIESYDNYIRLFPFGEFTPKFLAAAGGIYYNHKKFGEAKVYFQTLVKRFPGAEEKSLAMRSIMDSYFALGRFKDSEIIAKKIMSDTQLSEEQREFAGKRLGQAIFKNAEYLVEQGDYFAAANEFYRVYEEATNDERLVESAIFNAGLNYRKVKDWNRVVETLNILPTSFPKSKYALDALEYMADGYIELEQFDQAAMVYERIYTTYPQSPNAEVALYNSSLYFKKAQDWENAIRINNKYIAGYPLQPFTIDLFFSNADLFLKLGKIEEANRIYDEFAAKYPDDPKTITAYYERGVYYLKNGETETAKAEFNKAINRSELFRKQGKDPNAFIAAEAVNKLADILHNEFLAIKLVQPESRITTDQSKMKSLLTELNKTYSKVISFGSPRSFEATYNIARSFEEFAAAYSSQEIDTNLDDTKRFVQRKKIIEQSAALYDHAVDEYRKVVDNIPIIADKLGINLNDSLKITVVDDTSGSLLKRAAELDSTKQLAFKYQVKAKDKISELLYTEATLISENVEQSINIIAPVKDPLQVLLYRATVLQKVAKPAINNTIDAHLRNIAEAGNLGLSNKFVEESKRQVLLTSNILASEYKSLAMLALVEYGNVTKELERLLELDFGSKTNSGLDYYGLDNNANQLTDYTKILAQSVIENYQNTLTMAEEHQIKNDLVRSTKDNILQFSVEISDSMLQKSLLAQANRIKYEALFDSTQNYNYDDGRTFFDNYYYLLSDNSKSILETANSVKEQYQIKSLWANKLSYKLIKLDPVQYSGSIEKEKILLSSDESWKVVRTYPGEEWTKLGFDDSNWEYATIIFNNENQFARLNANPDAIWLPKLMNTDSFESDSLASVVSGIDSFAVSDTLLSMTADSSEISKQSFSVAVDSIAFFRKMFNVNGTPVGGQIYASADNDFRLYMNGEYILDDEANSYSEIDSTDFYIFNIYLKNGANVLGIDVEDKDYTGGGLKVYGYLEILPADLTAVAEEKTKVKKIDVDPIVLQRISILRKNWINPNQ